MPAPGAYDVGMKKQAAQYTIRDVPVQVDRELRRRARETGKSLNRVALDALSEGTGGQAVAHDDLDFLIGTLSPNEARRLEREIAAQRRIDAAAWK